MGAEEDRQRGGQRKDVGTTESETGLRKPERDGTRWFVYSIILCLLNTCSVSETFKVLGFSMEENRGKKSSQGSLCSIRGR